jgi:hypothetical protein
VQFDDLLLEQAQAPTGEARRRRAELGLYLRASTASNPSSTSWRLVRSTLAMLVSSAAAIRLSL